MSRNRLLYILVALVCVVAGLHLSAIVFHLYWTLWWYDMVPHLIGGIFVALLVLWIRFLSGYISVQFDHPPISQVFLLAFLGVIIIGISWEVFERLLGMTWNLEGYWADTITDMAMDIIGGLVGVLFFMKQYIGRQNINPKQITNLKS